AFHLACGMMFGPSGFDAVARLGSRKHPLESLALQPVPGLSGSRTNTWAPFELIDFEKSPRRSRSDGTVTKRGSFGVIWCGFSYAKKKNALSFNQNFPPSPNLGSGNGPLKLPPGYRWRYSGRSRPALLLKNGLPFNDSLRRK